MLAPVRGQRLADIVALAQPALLVAPDIALVAFMRLDQLALAHHFLPSPGPSGPWFDERAARGRVPAQVPARAGRVAGRPRAAQRFAGGPSIGIDRVKRSPLAR